MKCPGSTFASAKVLEKEVICEMSCSTFADAKVLNESDFICEMEKTAAQKRAEKKARQKANKNAVAQVTVPEVPQVPDDVAAQPLTTLSLEQKDELPHTLSTLEHKGELQAQHGAEPMVAEEKFADALQAYEEFLQEAEDEQIEDEEEDDEASVTSSMSALSMNSSTSVPLGVK